VQLACGWLAGEEDPSRLGTTARETEKGCCSKAKQNVF